MPSMEDQCRGDSLVAMTDKWMVKRTRSNFAETLVPLAGTELFRSCVNLILSRLSVCLSPFDTKVS